MGQEIPDVIPLKEENETPSGHDEENRNSTGA